MGVGPVGDDDPLVDREVVVPVPVDVQMGGVEGDDVVVVPQRDGDARAVEALARVRHLGLVQQRGVAHAQDVRAVGSAVAARHSHRPLDHEAGVADVAQDDLGHEARVLLGVDDALVRDGGAVLLRERHQELRRDDPHHEDHDQQLEEREAPAPRGLGTRHDPALMLWMATCRSTPISSVQSTRTVIVEIPTSGSSVWMSQLRS